MSKKPTAAAMRAAFAITSRFDSRPDPGLVRELARIIDAEFSDVVDALACIAEETDDSVAFGLAASALARVRGGEQ